MAVSDLILISNGTIITLGEESKVLEHHDLLINGNRISAIGPTGTIPVQGNVRSIDATNKTVLPGFINVHTHFYSAFARGLTKAAPAVDFNGVLNNLWWRLDKALTIEDCALSASVSLIEAIKQGTTSVIDHHASPHAVHGSLLAIAEAALQTGVRTALCYELSDRDGTAIANDGIAENADFIRYCRTNRNEMLTALFGMHASFTISEETMERAAEVVHELGVGVHIHVAEAESDQTTTIANTGMRVVQRLNRYQLLSDSTIAAHCVHLDETEIELLADTRTIVAHNPQSNLNNAVGIMDLVGYSKRGILVGIGTDAMTVDMPQEMRTALWCSRWRNCDTSVGFLEAANALYLNNSRIASRIWGIPIGVLSVGSVADVIVLDYNPTTPQRTDTQLGHLVFGIAEAPVDTTIIGGKIRMENRRLADDIDEVEINARARENAERLWQRF